ncbi:MAG TPA: hypothetical protein VFU49_23550 [Ktedonobacteraceae bacterium]|nr:hypothetical protein [Ktedonobacteraceae bacterium]
MRYYRPPRTRLYTSKDRLIITLLQALFFIAIGSALIYFNVLNINDPATDQVHKITGHITKEYTYTVNNQYSGTFINIDSSKDIYIFDKNTFTPAWDEHVTSRQRVDIYYKDGRPLRIIAIQLYDTFGNPVQQFTTPAFSATANQSQSSASTWGLVIGVVLVLISLLWSIKNIRSYLRSDKSRLVRM